MVFGGLLSFALLWSHFAVNNAKVSFDWKGFVTAIVWRRSCQVCTIADSHYPIDPQSAPKVAGTIATLGAHHHLALIEGVVDGVSLRQLGRDPAFSGMTAWALRRLMRSVRQAALEFARRQGDDEFLNAVERLTTG
jgi:hypothetical protein